MEFLGYFCNVNVVIRHIEYLMSRRDFVVIPGWGAILARYVPARIDEDRGVVVPPCRMFTFNGDLTHNDGALISSVARADGISYEAASAVVAKDVDAMRHQLYAHGEVSLGRIGVFSYDASDGSVDFAPYDTDRISVMSAWLPVVEAVPVMTEARSRAEREIAKSAVMSPIMRFLRVAASVAVLIVLGFVLSTPVSVDNVSYASLSLPEVRKADHRAFIPRPGMKTAPVTVIRSTQEDLYMVVDTASRRHYQEARRGRRMIPSGQAAAELRIDDADRYCVVVASLATLEEAEAFVAKEHDSNLGILDKDGRYRVYAATGASASQAYAAAGSAAIASRYPGAWVCRR